MNKRLLALALSVFASLAVSGRAAIVINEIMYHPSSELATEEWIELYNTDTVNAVSLVNWKFTNGVSYTFPAGTSIGAGGYLVVTANPAVFHAKYPAVGNYLAASGWQTLPNSGILSNSANRVELTDNLAVVRDSVSYADDGDWAVRLQDTVADFGHKGWYWQNAADGLGKSLELINPAMDNNVGQNWLASIATNGTPGAANGVAAADIAPFILNVAHFPIVPTSTDPVVVTAKIVDELTTGLTVTVHYRNDGGAGFTTATMFDDGAHGDGVTGDGVYGASLPAAANGTIVEFYVQAVDAGAHSRTWPAPASNAAAVAGQFCNCLYQVDNTVFAGAMPFYKIILRAVDNTELTQINRNTPAAPFGTSDQTLSHAKFNSTWITSDGTGVELRYLDGVRNRGHGSRSHQPQGYNISFPNADTWKGITSLNLNTQYTFSQLFGSALFRKAGLSCPDSRQVQLRVNTVDPTSLVYGTNTGVGNNYGQSFGFYVANEVEDSDFANHHYPLDSSGNIYRGNRTDSAPPANTMADAYLEYQAPVAGQTAADPYRTVFFKHTNSSEDDWRDLIALTQALAKATSDGNLNVTYPFPETEQTYKTAVEAVVDVEEWMQFFAVQTLVDNMETNISRGFGDDFYLYFGRVDKRAKFTPYDLDTVCGQGDASQAATTPNLFRMGIKDDAAANGATPLNAFMKHPAFAPIYYKHFRQLIDGPFTTANFNALADEILTGVVPQAQIDSIKTFQAARTAYISSLIPMAISVANTQTVAGTALPTQNGYTVSVAPRAGTTPASVTNADPAHCKLIGKANAITTRSVKVNGVDAPWSGWQTTWTAASVTLTPGINKILIQAFDGNSVETERSTQDIWYDDGSVVSKSGNAVTETWSAAAGPYQITAAFTVPSGVTLTIQPGTSVYVAAGVNITVASGGKILAEGTDTQHIRFTKTPGSTNWGGLTINGAGGSPETRIAYADFDSNNGVAIVCAGSTVYLDHLGFGNTAQPYVHLDGASFIVSNCIFPNTTAAFEPVHGTGGVKSGGYGIIRDCFFGISSGYSDIVDFTGGSRPSQSLIQFYNNVFMGSTDDILDLDGTDAWVEGNIFLHSHKNGSPDTSAAVSGGEDQGNAAAKSEITIIGNIFYDCDNTTTAKEGNFYTLINNTIVHQNRTGGTETRAGVVNLADDGVAQGVGTYLEGNIIYDVEALERSYSPALTSVVTFNNNLLPFAWTGPGASNTVADPLFKHVPAVSETNFATFQAAQIMREWLSLLPGSQGSGTGTNGRDKGGVISRGASVSGEPVGTTNATTATLTVGSNSSGFGIPTVPWPNGSGFTHYQWKLDGGAFSAETPIGTAISLIGLANGPHSVSVIGKNDIGLYQNDSKLGTDAIITVSKTWTVDTAYFPPGPAPNVRINEVLAKNTETQGFSGVFPDIIELRNSGNASADLSGWGLTDNTALPYRYPIPNGTTLAAGAYLVIYASNSASVPAPKTGFGLKDTGDTLTLTKSVAAGGGVADSIAFGAQLPDVSVGRRGNDSQWDMCKPTFGTLTGGVNPGAANVVAAQGTLPGVVINEWLTDAAVLATNDFIELYNPGTLPVNLGNCYLTNNPVEDITASQLRQLTFLAPAGYIYFKADGNTSQGPDHLAFKLTPTQGEIGFFDAAQNVLDRIIYGPQATDVSQGRTPNGANTFAFFNQPTPGGPNPGSVGGGSGTVNLVPATQSWKYFGATAPPANDGSARLWSATAYDDSTWVSRAQLLYLENAALTNTEGFVKELANPNANIFAANGTTLLGYDATHPYQTYYFRTHFTYSGSLSGVTLTAKIMLDDGAVIYLNGVEAARVRIDAGPVAYLTHANSNVSDAAVETMSIPATSLVVGDNVIAVSVHQNSAVDQSATAGSSDLTWGMKLDANVSTSSLTAGVVLNEILADNMTLQDPDGSFSGWVELYNTTASAVNVSDMSLTDDTSDARKFVFPSGSTVPASGYLVIYCNPLTAVSATNTHFGLSSAGGGMFLFKKLIEGGGLQDSVNWGQQVPDRSIGRSPNGSGAFTLNTVTRGALNAAAGLGTISTVKLNEWLALPPLGASWLELYNTGASPVLLTGNYLTDNLMNKTKHLVGPLTFIGGSGNTGNSRWLQLIADNDNGTTPNHVNFTLNPAGEALGIFSGGGVQLEAISFAAQSAGISGGRLADGGTITPSLNPTPGSANQSVSQDTDNDGIPDWWESLHGLNPNSAADAALDTDGDGQTNKAEYLAGTDPRNANDTLRAAITTTTPGQFNIQFPAQSGHSYTIQYKNLLTDTAWTHLTDILLPGTTTVDYPDTTVGANTKRFYRVVTPQVP